MSMIGEYARVTPQELDQILRDPQWGQDFVDGLCEAYPGEGGAAGQRVLDVDKAWNGIWYLLNAVGGAPVDVVGGGEQVSDDDWGYGPARYLTADDVRAAAAYLRETTWEALASHFDPAHLQAADIYPAIWDDPHALDYLRENFQCLVAFFAAAATVGDAIVLWLD